MLQVLFNDYAMLHIIFVKARHIAIFAKIAIALDKRSTTLKGVSKHWTGLDWTGLDWTGMEWNTGL